MADPWLDRPTNATNSERVRGRPLSFKKVASSWSDLDLGRGGMQLIGNSARVFGTVKRFSRRLHFQRGEKMGEHFLDFQVVLFREISVVVIRFSANCAFTKVERLSKNDKSSFLSSSIQSLSLLVVGTKVCIQMSCGEMNLCPKRRIWVFSIPGAFWPVKKTLSEEKEPLVWVRWFIKHFSRRRRALRRTVFLLVRHRNLHEISLLTVDL